jgi:hypothetical protein
MFAPYVSPLFYGVSRGIKTDMNETGPDATPPVVLTVSPLGLSLEKEKPVPPPVLWIIAVFLLL